MSAHPENAPSASVQGHGPGAAASGIVLCAVLGASVGLTALLASIATRKSEARQVAAVFVPLSETTTDPAAWGVSFPRQLDGYRRTVDVERTRHGGSEAFQKLDQDPRWRELFRGYAFSIDYREERGHAYMLQDQRETERQQLPQPGACLHCHASVIVPWRQLGIEKGAPGTLEAPLLSSEGWAQLQAGFEAACPTPYAEATQRATHPVACIDCHDPTTLGLRVTRPAFVTGIRALARSQAPVPPLPSVERWRKGSRARDYDPNQDASRQELRTLVCAQCHVEYYFHGPEKRLTYPWEQGLLADQIEARQDAAGFKDWTHPGSGAPLLKAQHPEFELWSQGIHARSGVSCADCHMPYVREGAVKVSDHHVQSPLLHPERSCQTCHGFDGPELRARAEAIQDRTQGLLQRGEVAVLDAIGAIAAAAQGGAKDEALARARALHRAAQWRLDFVAAENSLGFHAPHESARLLGEAIDLGRQAQVAALGAGR